MAMPSYPEPCFWPGKYWGAAMGMSPKMVVKAVIKMGWSRSLPPRTRASRRDMPLARRRCTRSSRRIALFTTMPASSTMPTPTMVCMELLVSHKVMFTPMRASTMETRIEKGSTTDSSRMAMSR